MLEQHTASCSEGTTHADNIELTDGDVTNCPSQDRDQELSKQKSDVAPSTKDTALNQIFHHAARCGSLTGGDDPEVLFQTIRFLYKDIDPKGATEMLLASQIIGGYLITMHQMHMATKECTADSVKARINICTKLMRVQTQQLNLLTSLKGMRSQNVRVTHLSISGGNSVIGIGSAVKQGGQ